MIFDKQRRNTQTGEYLKAFPVPGSRFHTFPKSLQKHGGTERNTDSPPCVPSSLDENHVHSHMENSD